MHWFYDPAISPDSGKIASGELVHFKALRINPGEHIAISSGSGRGFSAKVVDPRTGEIQILQEFEQTQKPKVHLFQAIAKGGRDEIALQACVELGVASATAFEAERSIANWRGKEQKGVERWEQIAVSAMKQSQQLWLPSVNYAKSAKNLKPLGLGLVLDPWCEDGIASIPISPEYSVAVGPEGGFSDRELLDLEAAGFQRVRLGRSVLRTSTAGVVAVSALQLLSGEYGGRIG